MIDLVRSCPAYPRHSWTHQSCHPLAALCSARSERLTKALKGQPTKQSRAVKMPIHPIIVRFPTKVASFDLIQSGSISPCVSDLGSLGSFSNVLLGDTGVGRGRDLRNWLVSSPPGQLVVRLMRCSTPIRRRLTSSRGPLT
jgi:hypothetical protein